MVTDEFSSYTSGKVFKVKVCASRKYSNVICLIMFWRCGLQYLGETGQPLRMRVNGHRYDSTHWRTKEYPMMEHFKSGTHEESGMAVMAIEFARGRDAFVWKIRQSRWIRSLRTLFPLGMNLRVEGL